MTKIHGLSKKINKNTGNMNELSFFRCLICFLFCHLVWVLGRGALPLSVYSWKENKREKKKVQKILNFHGTNFLMRGHELSLVSLFYQVFQNTIILFCSCPLWESKRNSTKVHAIIIYHPKLKSATTRWATDFILSSTRQSNSNIS